MVWLNKVDWPSRTTLGSLARLVTGSRATLEYVCAGRTVEPVCVPSDAGVAASERLRQ